MAKFITDGETEMGVYHLPGKARPVLAFCNDVNMDVYAYFMSQERADEFMERLSTFLDLKGKEDDKA